MKPRAQFFILICVLFLVLCIAWYSLPGRRVETLQAFRGVVNRDCAPWDGAAFTVSIPLRDDATLAVSIWQAPEIMRPIAFIFPDDSFQVGNAALSAPDGILEQLAGEVWFERVEHGQPVEGRFHLQSERGSKFDGQFTAVWGNLVAMCG